MKMPSAALLIALLPGGCWASGFEATEPAEVLGEPVRSTDPAQIQETIITRLLDQYAEERDIRAEPAEIDALLNKMRRDERTGDGRRFDARGKGRGGRAAA
jgi:hypothetical protein